MEAIPTTPLQSSLPLQVELGGGIESTELLLSLPWLLRIQTSTTRRF
jgi:hypothetical protein